jgi:trehalose utilization protein
MIRVTVWNEYVHEREYEGIRAVYPEGIHGCIAQFLGQQEDLVCRIATLDMPEHGLTEEVLQDTDVLIWWSHAKQEEVSDIVVERVCQHIRMGMGFIGLHSAHFSKVLRRILGTSMTLHWRHGDMERLWCVNPAHPIARGIPTSFELPKEEMYGEPFGIPQPDELVFVGWFSGGEVFRSGVTFTRENGKIFYFQPGHEEYPIYHMPLIQQIIINAVRWAAPVNRLAAPPDNVEAV